VRAKGPTTSDGAERKGRYLALMRENGMRVPNRAFPNSRKATDAHIGCMFAHEHRWPECYDDAFVPAADACRTCAGIGTVRIPGRPGSERQPCPACGGSGMLRPSR
jgi:hypothetical protein